MVFQYQDDMPRSQKVKEALQRLHLSHEQLKSCKKRFEECIEDGLSLDRRDKCSLKMLPSFVRDTPNGSEYGDFLALDLGGTNFRVLHVKLAKDKDVHIDNQIYRLPMEIMQGSGEKLFDYIAACIEEFLDQYDLRKKKLPLGFTFSFPCAQSALANGVLVRWTKGFSATGVVGKDVVELLQNAIDKRGGDHELEVIAIINDTVGTMMSCAYDDHDCVIGMIVGTGTNACYMEKTDNMRWFHENNTGEMCINLEWGCYGEKGELDDVRTEYDFKVDEGSINPGTMFYEKMVSGMYLGEVVRTVLVGLIKSGALFNGVCTNRMQKHNSFQTAFVTQIDSDRSNNLRACSQVLHHFGYMDDTNPDFNIACGSDDESKETIVLCTQEDKRIVKDICEAVSTRAAHLSAIGVAALLTKVKNNHDKDGCRLSKRLAVGVDGTVYKKHLRFKQQLQNKVIELMPPGIEIDFHVSNDGSGKGAALVSAVAWRLSCKPGSDL